ncbi:Sec63-domain-containing protein [Amniculicola lignicola CBS 123094]|uniref:RNA helicase n=1 Tax=Amniculicola lignicola CBS 123094 TaxID=1392246 RepID=A0A6A5WPL4_9PLEO|nr:Sec63-domain-containing protein [Amniculicola lignicola CBS 123094]
MANQPNLSGYKYTAMSNLVLSVDKRFVTRHKDENTGDPESLAGRINIHDMGGRIIRDDALSQSGKTKTTRAIERGKINEGNEVLEREQRKRKRGGEEAELLVEDLKYKPRTPATRATFDLITTIVSRTLGEVPGHVTRSAADAVLEFLKDDNMKDLDKKREVDELLGSSMRPKEFNELVNLGKKITDYEAQDEEGDEGQDLRQKVEMEEDFTETRRKDEVVDEGVAVVFDEDEDDNAAQNYEVRDEDTSDDEADAPSDLAAQDAEDETATMSDKDDLIIQGDAATQADAARIDLQDEETEQLIPVDEIDAYWMQRQIGLVYDDAVDQQEKTKEALTILENEDDRPVNEIENDLMDMFNYEHHDLVAKLVANKDRIVWVTKWRATAEKSTERSVLEREIQQAGHRQILQELLGQAPAPAATQRAAAPKLKFDLSNITVPTASKDTEMQDAPKTGGLIRGLQPSGRITNLENLVFEQGNHLMSNPNVKLPQGSTRRQFKGYEEIHVPPPKAKRDPNERLMPTSEMPAWARQGFGSSQELNRIQTKCYPTAFNDDSNMLICAPTGSGKTNVAMLAILREIGKHMNPETGEIALDEFKIIFIAPLKALVQEQVGNFGKRLEVYGIKVAELTGDRQLTKQQIAETQVIVTTPEKYDVITRKATDTSYINLVRLVCIDEIHLLHDDRGPVLESLVSRTIRRSQQTGDHVRLVGLSATLPNYHDVARFLHVDPDKGLFYFDGTFRPCPLKQEYIGVTDKKAIKQIKMMNDVCYTKVLEHVGQNRNQLIIFVHSRKETAKTAKYIRDKALESETIGQILRSDSSIRHILQSASAEVQNADLKDLMPYGFGIHHAGMSRDDRSAVEDLFADGSIQVLVSTSTLAWGVNLPAHTVIIKGTQVYSPEKGSWIELSPQDVLQMLGRAGRPQFDTYGEGIIITTQAEMQYYLSLLNQQLPIESQLVGKLADNLNAEVVLGNVRTRDDGVDWLGYTYLFVRMNRSPGLYSVGAEYEDDHLLERKRVDLIHAAATVLERCGLVRYDKKTGLIQSTELGRIASHYYISYKSMSTYNQHIQPGMSSIEMFRVFAMSEEFKYIPVRQDEKLELAKLLERVPVPIKEPVEEPTAKINALLQAYISRLRLEGLAVMADLVYVTQSAQRIMRAIFEICLKKGYAEVSRIALELCKTIEQRMWPSMSPLRQFPKVPKDVVQKSERIGVPFKTYFDLDPPHMGELLGLPKAGRLVCGLVEKFPRLQLEVETRPITRSILKLELTIRANFVWDDDIHGTAQSFWILVEDCDGEQLLFHDQFILRKEFATAEDEQMVDFTVPIDDPKPPNYFVSIISDRWMGAETKLAVEFFKVLLPPKFPAPTAVLELQPVTASGLKKREYVDLYKHVQAFNRVQSQVFNTLYASDDNAFVGASAGVGKTFCAEFAMLRHWMKKGSDEQRIIYIAPFQELVDNRYKGWKERFATISGGKEVVKLTGDNTADIRLIGQGDLILATPSQWDVVSRTWRRRRAVNTIALFIADDVHMIGGSGGSVYETILTRMSYMKQQLDSGLRIVALSVPLADGREFGNWIGATKHTIFNFSPSVRAVPLELRLQSFTIPHFPSLMLAMAKPAYNAITQLSPDKPALVFVPSRKQARKTALDIFGACVADGNEDRFLNTNLEEIQPILEKVDEKALAESLSHGIGYYHEALTAFDKRAVLHLFKIGAIQVILASRDCCWELETNAHLVIVMGTQFYEGKEHRYIDYRISDLLQMYGRAGRVGQDKSAKGVLMVPAVKREYYKKFLNESLPIESTLHESLHENFVAEISGGEISSLQDAMDLTTFSYMYRRLLINPSYYNLYSLEQDDISNWLSNLVEGTIKDLAEAGLVEYDQEAETGPVAAENACMIASHYNISFVTMQTLRLSLNAKSTVKNVLEIITAATEFEDLQIRRHENHILERIYERVPNKMQEVDMNTPHFKAFVLLQAHFSRMQLPIDLAKDQEIVVKKVINLLYAAVDVLSSEGHLSAMRPMDVSQMVIQAMWIHDSPLKQIPHFGSDTIKEAKKFGISDIFEFMEAMDPEENEDYPKLIKALGLNNKQLAEAATFTNEYYPNVEFKVDPEEPHEVVCNSPAILNVTVAREIDEEDEPKDMVHAPFFPGTKTESFWVVVADKKLNYLLGIKKFSVGRKISFKLQYTVNHPGEHELTAFMINDSYMGVDQEPTFKVTAVEGMDEDDDEDDEEDDEDGDEDEDDDEPESMEE